MLTSLNIPFPNIFMFAITDDVQIRGEVNQNLRIIATKTHALYGKTKRSRKIMELNSKNRRFHIYEGQILSVQDLKRENDFMKDEIVEWKKNYAKFQEDKEKLYQEMLLAVQEREQEISKLQHQNKELLGYIECLQKKESLQNKGKDISEVKKKKKIKDAENIFVPCSNCIMVYKMVWFWHSRHSSKRAKK